MSPATYFYFDQPYEPDFEERGLYWATRSLDSRTAFSFVPDHLYWNRGRTQDGGEMTDEILCTGGCPPLTQPQNIRGQYSVVLILTLQAVLVFLNEKVHKNISCHKNFLKANQFFDTTCVYKILWPTQDVLQIFIIMNKFITSELQIKVTANKNLFQYCT